MSKKKICVFLFHRDLRLNDNTSLLQAHHDGYTILPVFVFEHDQIDPTKNRFFSNNSVQFMCESLIDLDGQIKENGGNGILFLKGDTVECLKDIRKHIAYEALYTNEDYTQYAKKRDKEIEKWCNKKGVSYNKSEDYGLLPLSEGLLDDERPYMVLAQYYRRIQEHETIKHVINFPKDVMFSKSIISNIVTKLDVHDIKKFYKYNENILVHGGRRKGIEQLHKIQKLKDYKEKRDFPALPKTSMMSAYLKFGCISVREMYWYIQDLFGKNHALIRELVFRDFYMKIYTLKPELQRGQALHDRLDKAIPWSYDKKLFRKWCDGRTGYPIVDAGMRQLNMIGWQHNRVRMITSNILTKYLLIDWRLGERYFAQKLVDYDPASNAMGWQWSASVGPDAVPYFRAPFNPFIQSKKFDSDAEYIKKWVPELKDVDSKDIHKWGEEKIRAKYPNINYPAPILDQREASQRAVRIYKEAFEKSKRL